MNTNELRRENLIFEDVLGTCTVESIFNNKLEISVPNGKTDGTINKRWFIMDSYNFRPILLTEEWFLKFGFDKGSDIIGDCFYIELKNNDDFIIHIENDKMFLFDDDLEIKHVHQLQNLYFALTQKELIYENRNKTS